jgi:hypothetical protein
MGTTARPPGHYGFAFGDDVIDYQPNIGERGAVKRRELQEA